MNPKKSKNSLSIVVPVYNESECINANFFRLQSAVSKIDLEFCELIFVNDGSTDDSRSLLNSILLNYSNNYLRIINLNFTRNFGHSAAVLAGIERSTGDIVAIIDADLQDPPELLPEMIGMLNEKIDVVYGQRIKREGETFFKRISAYLFYRFLIFASGINFPPDTGDFRVMKRKVVNSLLKIKEQDPFLRGLVSWVGYNQIGLKYIRKERFAGETKYPLKKMLKFAGKAIISFSNSPLSISLFLTFFGLLGCFVLSIWATVLWLEGITIPGWASIILAFSLGQTLSYLVSGVLGLYIGRIYQQVKNRPVYLLDEEI